MKKMTAFLAAIAVMGISGKAVALDDGTYLPSPQTTLNVQVDAHTHHTVPEGEDYYNTGGGIQGMVAYAAYSGTEGYGEYGLEGAVGTGAAVVGGADLHLEGLVYTGCDLNCGDDMDAGFITLHQEASGMAGHGPQVIIEGGEQVEGGEQAVWATAHSHSSSTHSNNAYGNAGITSGAAAGDGNVIQHAGGSLVLNGIIYHPDF